MAENIGEILYIDPGLDTTYEKIDKRIMDMSKHADVLSGSLDKVRSTLESIKAASEGIPPLAFAEKAISDVDTLVEKLSSIPKVNLGVDPAQAEAFIAMVAAASLLPSKVSEAAKSTEKLKKSTEELKKEEEELIRKEEEARRKRIGIADATKTLYRAMTPEEATAALDELTKKHDALTKELMEAISEEKKFEALASSSDAAMRSFAEGGLESVRKKMVELHSEFAKIGKDFATISSGKGTISREVTSMVPAAAMEPMTSTTLMYSQMMAQELRDLFAIKPDISSIDSYAKALERAKEIVADMKSRLDQGFFSKDDVSAAEAKLKRMTQTLRELKNEKKELDTIASNNALASSIMKLPMTSLDQMREKLSRITSLIAKLQNSKDPSVYSGTIAILTKQADYLNSKLAVTQNMLQRTSTDASYLKSRLSMTFGIMGITQFVKSVVKVRGEFEMIQKSLEVLVQDTTKAREIFSDIQDIAIKSPYQIKDLARQTKQLAAYGIETDKLVSRTKMLGDIAAGTGVEIQRLSLAYGQIRAAQFLKGTEARQLTEAGVDIYGALSKYYSELNNRMVSVSEVLDMQRRKLITFEDVDTVLQRMTSVGGKFFEMQEKQAETIQGMLSNLQDRADKMFNEIGMDFEDLIKNIINLMNWILSNSGAVEAAVSAWAGFRIWNLLTMAISKSILKFVTSTNVIKANRVAFLRNLVAIKDTNKTLYKSILLMDQWKFAIGAAIAAMIALYMAYRRFTQNKRELEEITKENNASLANEIHQYNTLSKVLKSDTATREEKSKALQEMKDKYGQILPMQQYEIDNISELNDNYGKHIAILRQYYEEKKKQEGIQKITDNAYDSFNADGAAKAMVRSMDPILKAYNNKAKKLGNDMVVISQEEMQAAVKSAFDAMFEGEISSVEEAYKMVLDLLGNIADIPDDLKDKLLNAFDDSPVIRFEHAIHSAKKAFSDLSKFLSDDVDLSLGAKEAKQYIDRLNKSRTDYIESHKDDGKYVNNAPQLEIDAENAMAQEKKAIIKELDGLDSEMRKVLEKKINDAFSNVNVTGIEASIRKKFAELNASIAGMDTGGWQFGGADTEMKQSEDFDEYGKRISKLVDERKKIIALINDPNNNDELKWQNFLAVFSFKDLINEWADAVSEGDTLKLEGIKAKAKNRANNIVAAQEQFSSFLDYTDPKEAAKKASEYKKNIASFIKELKSASSDWDDLTAAARELEKKKLQLKADKLNLSFNSEELVDRESVLRSAKKLLEEKKISEEDYLELSITFETDKAKEQISDLKDDISDLWDQYEFAKNLSDFKINIDGYSAIDILKKIAAKEDELREISTKSSIEAADDVSKKRIQMVREERNEALKIIQESEVKAAGKAVKAYTEAYDNINKIISDANKFDVNDTQKGEVDQERIKAAINKQLANAAKEAAEAEWEAYKSTEMYIASFGDLENIGTDVLIKLKSKLEDYKNSSQNVLNPTEVKTLVNTIKEMEDQINMRSDSKTFLGMLADGMENLARVRRNYKDEVDSAYSEWIRDMNLLEEAQNREDEARRKQAEAINEQNEAKEALEANGGMAFADGDVIDAYLAAQANAERTTKELAARIEDTKTASDRASLSMSKYNKATESLSKAVKKVKNEIGTMKNALDAVGNAISSSIDYVKSIGDAFGQSFDDDTVEVIDSFTDGFGLVAGAVGVLATGIEAYNVATSIAITETMTLETLLWPLLLIAAALAAITAALKAADNAIKRNIEYHQNKLDSLEKAYDKLEDKMDEVFTMNSVGKVYEDQLENLTLQRKELEQIIALEKSRKKPDTDTIKSSMEDIAELEETARKAKDKIDDIMGKPTDYQSLAKSWTDAWREAFSETGDGLDSLYDSFDEMVNNLLTGQLSLMVMGPMIAKLKQLVNDITSDMQIDQAEWAQLANFKDTVLKSTNEQLKAMLTALGMNTSGSSLVTDTIQKGIQSLTEDTGVALESLANSMRGHLANIDGILSSVFSDGEGGNPFLVQMRTQTELTRDIKSLLSDVIKGGHSEGGFGIKVFA